MNKGRTDAGVTPTEDANPVPPTNPDPSLGDLDLGMAGVTIRGQPQGGGGGGGGRGVRPSGGVQETSNQEGDISKILFKINKYLFTFGESRYITAECFVFE